MSSNAGAAVHGGKVTYTATGDYDFQVTEASKWLLNDGTKYTIDQVFKSIGDPQYSLVEKPHRFWNALMFADSAPVYGVTGSTTLVGGTGGTNGTFALAIPTPTPGGTTATGTFTVVGGIVTAITITAPGSQYTNAPISLTNSAFAASANITGASATLTVGVVG